MSPKNTFIIILFVLSSSFACKQIEPSGPEEENILNGPIEELTSAERILHLKGDAAFAQSFNSETGLGPLFVATSCQSCHSSDGKGHPFTTLIRFGQWDSTGNHYIDKGAPQLQNRAIPGYLPEELPTGISYTKLIAPAVTGLGYIDAVSDADILNLADPNDANGDGISGVVNWISIPNYVIPRTDAIQNTNGKYIGRFGKKSAAYDLLMQTSLAYNQDMGIVSANEAIDTYTKLESEPEINLQTLFETVFYLKTLKVPPVRNADDKEVVEGKQLFMNAGCASCHKQELKTGNSSIEALSNKSFFPYTDMLLHDMGNGLDDGYTEGSAKTYEWRTPALWGLGLTPKSQGGNYFLMHDGRAKSIQEAILLHGGEATKSISNFSNLNDADRLKLLKFLENL